ncbi:unnamed protein product [Heligmosomoides polygyrus]|uniref:ShTK domain protein n=1 Tax=Heligmosomoides polygyrus TaxID=6339 RepID=A0A183G6T0_HELPZ|nr:unnamed protein product [Heligmosomoides polygyrus]
MYRFFVLLTVVEITTVAQITDESCTYVDGGRGVIDKEPMFQYTAAAVRCDNVVSDAACSALHQKEVKAGTTDEREDSCFKKGNNKDDFVIASVVATCPKTCGYCCLTPAFNCKDKDAPRMACDKVTDAMCKEDAWKAILAEDCPSSCGLCNAVDSNCKDKVTGCDVDKTICENVNWQTFVKYEVSRCSGVYSSAILEKNRLKFCSRAALLSMCPGRPKIGSTVITFE